MSGDGMLKLGPTGDRSGKAWDEKGHDKIAQIFISHCGYGINWIQFQYADQNGRLELSQRHGNTDGPKFDVVKLKHATEYITCVSGRCRNNLKGSLCSITFGTNLGEYGPFGSFTGQDREFYFKLGGENDRQFGGFHGTTDFTVNSIGVYLNPNVALHDDRRPRSVQVSDL